MYKKFDFKKDKELILLNYYILANLADNKIDLTTVEVAEALEINKTKAHRLLTKLQELGIIKLLRKSDSKNKKTTFLYILNEMVTETDNETVELSNIKQYTRANETVSETVNEKDSNKKTYKTIYKEVFKDANEVQINATLNLAGLEMIDVELFKAMLEEAALKANKNPHSYARTVISNSIRDNIRTLKDRAKFQEKRSLQAKKEKDTEERCKNWNYTEDAEGIDFDYLASLTRRY